MESHQNYPALELDGITYSGRRKLLGMRLELQAIPWSRYVLMRILLLENQLGHTSSFSEHVSGGAGVNTGPTILEGKNAMPIVLP
jgi:hypothetical protein